MMRPPRMGGGSMLRAVSRVVSSGTESLSSSSSLPTARGDGEGDVCPLRVPSPPAAGAAALAEWEAVRLEDGEGDEGGNGFEDRWIFGPVPSIEEVQAAVLSLQQISFQATFSEQRDNADEYNLENKTEEQEIVSIPLSNGSSGEILTESESDWIEPTLHACNQVSFSSSKDRQRVLEAFQLLQVNPSIQKMVVSLSSDKAVWDAVMNNEVVQELKKSFQEGISEDKNADKNDDPFENLGAALNHIFGNTKAKVIDFIKSITNIVNKIFHHSESEENDDEKIDICAEAVRSSLMLSVIVLLVVIVTRVKT